jgi:hypothetical protein
MLPVPPGWPVMGREGHSGLGGEHLDRLGEVSRPDVRVAYQGASEGQQVVQVVGGVLGHAERTLAGKVEMHLSRASVPGAIWRIIRTPSTVRSWPVAVMVTVGSMSVTLPVETVWPRPAPTPPCGPRGRAAPYIYAARRPIAVPA